MKNRKGKHITERERYIIEYMMKEGRTPNEIALETGKSISTIYREIKRGLVTQRNSDYTEKTVYLADYAQNDYNLKKREKGRNLKIGNDYEFVRYMEYMIKECKYSPAAALYELRKNNNIRTRICHRTLYKYIHNGIFYNLKDSDLPYKARRRKEGEERNICTKNIKGKSIEQRPKTIYERIEYGHWEMDTVYSGKGKSKACLLVLTERKTREEQLYYMESRTQDEVINVLNSIEKSIGLCSFIKKYKSFTCDNGMEFLNWEGIENSCKSTGIKRTDVYYCHPFNSCERASNENQNKLIRRWIPKGEDIAKYKKDVKFIEDWINNYPRKIFGGMSSNEFKESAC